MIEVHDYNGTIYLYDTEKKHYMLQTDVYPQSMIRFKSIEEVKKYLDKETK